MLAPVLRPPRPGQVPHCLCSWEPEKGEGQCCQAHRLAAVSEQLSAHGRPWAALITLLQVCLLGQTPTSRWLST